MSTTTDADGADDRVGGTTGDGTGATRDRAEANGTNGTNGTDATAKTAETVGNHVTAGDAEPTRTTETVETPETPGDPEVSKAPGTAATAATAATTATARAAATATTVGTPRAAGVPGPRAPGWLGVGRPARRAHRTAVTHQAASVLLGYPDQAFFERLPLVARAVAELPRGPVRTGLLEFCEHASSTPEPALCEHYAQVFDLRRDRSLHMTFYTDGDARRRGRTLAEVRRVYGGAGWSVPEGELPDHLAVVLEFAARRDAAKGGSLLLRFRPGLDLLSEALRDHGTPYARVVDAVRTTLPPQWEWEHDRVEVRRSAAQGTSARNGSVEPGGGVRVPLPRRGHPSDQAVPDPGPDRVLDPDPGPVPGPDHGSGMPVGHTSGRDALGDADGAEP